MIKKCKPICSEYDFIQLTVDNIYEVRDYLINRNYKTTVFRDFGLILINSHILNPHPLRMVVGDYLLFNESNMAIIPKCHFYELYKVVGD